MRRVAVPSRSALPLAAVVLAMIAGLAFTTGLTRAQQPPPNLQALHDRSVGLFDIRGVVFTDVDQTTGRLVVGVENLGLATAVQARLGRLSIPSGLVDIVVSPPIIRMDTLRDEVRPLGGGLQIHFEGFVCTLGFNATRNGVSGFVTASHCTGEQGVETGTEYYQPHSQTSSQSIGTETVDPPYTAADCPESVVEQLESAVCRWSDASFAQLAAGVPAQLGSLMRTTGVNTCRGAVGLGCSLTIDGRFDIVGEASPSLQMTANKVGRSTGWTQAPIVRECAHTRIGGTDIVLLCQGWAQSSNRVIVAGGDSGSPVFAGAGGDNVSLLGVLWGGTGDGRTFVFSPMSGVQQDLGAMTVVGNGGVVDSPPTVSITSPSHGDTVEGNVTISASASDDNGVTQVEFFVNNASIGTGTLSGSTWSVVWDSTSVSDGVVTLRATATDTIGQTAHHSINVTVSNGGEAGPGDPQSVAATVTYSMHGGPQGDRHLRVTISVTVAGTSTPVSGASVSGTLSNTDTGGEWPLSGTTGGDGSVSFQFNNAPAGCYTTEVQTVSGNGIDWSGTYNEDNEQCKPVN